MGSPTSPFPDPDSPEREIPVRDGSFAAALPPPPDAPVMVFGDPGEFWRREPKRRYIILFLLTLLTTTLVGALNDAPFLLALQRGSLGDALRAVPHGFWYSLPVLGILGA